MTTTASAPGKVILLGEHAAVYGNPVLVATVDKRSYASVSLRADEKYTLNNPSVGVNNLSFSREDIPRLKKEWNLALSMEAIEKIRSFLDESRGLDISLRSDIPVSSGLGSSASISSALIYAMVHEMGHELELDEVAGLAWEVENLIHKKSSGVDPFSVTYGGIVRYQKGEVKRLDVRSYPEITIGNTKVRSDTGDVVMDVMRLKEEFPLFFKKYLDVMVDVVNTGEVLLCEGDVAKFGELMNINHGLLSAIGVSCLELEELVWAARKVSCGAKLCGAGRGGIMVALGDASKEIEAAGGEVIKTRIASEGVRLEP